MVKQLIPLVVDWVQMVLLAIIFAGTTLLLGL